MYDRTNSWLSQPRSTGASGHGWPVDLGPQPQRPPVSLLQAFTSIVCRRHTPCHKSTNPGQQSRFFSQQTQIMKTKPTWKSRFSEQQLERKRQVDRAGQQKLRRQSKETTKQLEERVRLAVKEEHAALVQSLLEENARLKRTIDRYRTRLEDVAALVNPCLSSCENDGHTADQSAVNTYTQISRHAENRDRYTSTKTPSLPPLPRITSVFFQAKDLIVSSDWSGAADFSANKILEAVMFWKLSNNHGLGPRFLEGILDLNNRTGLRSASGMQPVSMAGGY